MNAGTARFEYRTQYVEIPMLPAAAEKTSLLGRLFQRPGLGPQPDVQRLQAHDVFEPILVSLGAEGWELVSVQPVSRAEVSIGNENAQGWAYGFAMPIGVVLFLKRLAASPSLHSGGQGCT